MKKKILIDCHNDNTFSLVLHLSTNKQLSLYSPIFGLKCRKFSTHLGLLKTKKKLLFRYIKVKKILIKFRSAVFNYVKNSWKAFFSISFISIAFKPYIKHCFDAFALGPFALFASFGLLFALFCLLRPGFKNTNHNFSIKWFIFNIVVGSIMAYCFNKLGSFLNYALFPLFLTIWPKFLDDFIISYGDSNRNKLVYKSNKPVYNSIEQKKFFSVCLCPVEDGDNPSVTNNLTFIPWTNNNANRNWREEKEQPEWVLAIMNDPSLGPLVSLMDPYSPVPSSEASSPSLRSSQIDSVSNISDQLQQVKLKGVPLLHIRNSRQWDGLIKNNSDICFKSELSALTNNELKAANNSLMNRIREVVMRDGNVGALDEPISRIHTGTASTSLGVGSETNYLSNIMRYMPFDRKKYALVEPVVREVVIHWAGFIQQPSYQDSFGNPIKDLDVKEISKKFKSFYNCLPTQAKENRNLVYTHGKLMSESDKYAQNRYDTFINLLTEQKLHIKLEYILEHGNIMVVWRTIRSDLMNADNTVKLKSRLFNEVIDLLRSDRTTTRQQIENRITQYSLNSPLMPLVKANRSILSDPDLLENFRRP